jgi:hypothetical protein
MQPAADQRIVDRSSDSTDDVAHSDSTTELSFTIPPRDGSQFR